ncbi:MAG TPA: glycosyltransferase family 39 protein [Thermomicrobiales bacterium]|jgi:4-amino-4-deoxy-L-arabinose transferase-like glycosyltransferase
MIRAKADRRQVRKRQARGWRAIVSRLRPAEVEVLILLALFGLALLVRWPYLLRLPHFTDELGEVRWALSIWRGEQFPLTAQETYLGALHAYILASGFWLFGPSVALPRVIVCVIGALTVACTYLLGRELAGRPVGLLAAALLLTLPQHILVNSHVAWQNSTTPLYATVALWAFAKSWVVGRESREGTQRSPSDEAPPIALTPHDPQPATSLPWLIFAGFAFGLALETHPGVIVLAPALVLAFGWRLWRARAWGLLRSAGPWAGLAAALVGVGPLLFYNLTRGLVGVERVQRSRGYAFESDHSLGSYLRNLKNLLLELARMLSDPFHIPERALAYLASPHLLIVVALCIGGLVVLLRRGQPLPALALLCTALAMPYFNHAYGVDGDRPIVTGRYVAFLLPPLLVAIAAGVSALLGRAMRHLERRLRRGASGLSLSRAVVGGLLTVLVLYPLVPLGRYYREEAARDPANATFLETLRVIGAARGPGTPVLLDRNGLINVDLRDGASAFDILDVLLTLDGVPHTVTRAPGDDAKRLAAGVDPADTAALPLVVMMRDECWPLRDRVPLQRISGRLVLRELYPTVPSYYGVYRYAAPGQPGGCLPPGGATPGD